MFNFLAQKGPADEHGQLVKSRMLKMHVKLLLSCSWIGIRVARARRSRMGHLHEPT